MGAQTVKSFIKQFVAHVKGDNVAIMAEKVFRQAETSLRIHISVFEGKVQQMESNIDTAYESAKKALINEGSIIIKNDIEQDSADYVNKILTKEKEIETATANHLKHSKILEILKAKLQELYKTEIEEEEVK